jgi:hypothetical protein
MMEEISQDQKKQLLKYIYYQQKNQILNGELELILEQLLISH